MLNPLKMSLDILVTFKFILLMETVPITAIGGISSFLTNCFVSPGLTSNLIYVGQLVDNDCKVAFLKFDCLVLDQQLGKMIAKGPKVEYLFENSTISNS